MRPISNLHAQAKTQHPACTTCTMTVQNSSTAARQTALLTTCLAKLAQLWSRRAAFNSLCIVVRQQHCCVTLRSSSWNLPPCGWPPAEPLFSASAPKPPTTAEQLLCERRPAQHEQSLPAPRPVVPAAADAARGIHGAKLSSLRPAVNMKVCV